jgi:PBP1b-binding outer membrane lipoprotein LpoB
MRLTKSTAAVTAAVVSLLLILGGCTTTQSATTSSTTSTKAPTKASTEPKGAATTGEGSAFCAAFEDLASRHDPNVMMQTKDEGGWDLDIATVTKIAASAPASEVNDAGAYVEMMKDRKALAASYDYGTVPTEAARSFGLAHAALQAQVNDLLHYAHSACAGLK